MLVVLLLMLPASIQADWTRSYSVQEFSAAMKQELAESQSDATKRVRECASRYHTRPFLHSMPSIQVLDPNLYLNATPTAHPWLGRRAHYVPQSNRELNTAALEATKVFRLTDNNSRLRIIYIKSYKVASTTISSLFARLSVKHSWRVLKDLPRNFHDIAIGRKPTPPEEYEVSYAHNWYANSNTTDYWATCNVTANNLGIASCGGYQPWMDFYIPISWRLVMVADPLQRVASMFYFEQGYTKPSEKGRKVDGPAYSSPQSPGARALINKFLSEYTYQWKRVQWHWLREGTPNHTLDEVSQMLRNNAFLVGLSEYFDHSLLLWRFFMGLSLEDIVYVKYRSAFQHPMVHEWHAEEIARATAIVEASGDFTFYRIAKDVFEAQVKVYGGWTRLNRDAAILRHIISNLEHACKHVDMDHNLGLNSKSVCFVANFRLLGMERTFNKAFSHD